MAVSQPFIWLMINTRSLNWKEALNFDIYKKISEEDFCFESLLTLEY